MKKIIFCIFMLIFGLSTVYAETCDAADKKRIEKIIDNVQIKYEKVENVYDEFGNYITNGYKINVENMPEDAYIEFNDGDKEVVAMNFDGEVNFYIANSNEEIISEFANSYYFNTNDKKTITILGDTCRTVTKDVTVGPPKYNPYSEREECKGVDISKFKACDPYYDLDVTDNIFNYQLKEYQKNTNNDDNKKTDDKTKNKNQENEENSLLNYVKKYGLYIIGITVLFFLVAFVIKKQKDKRGVL